MGTHRRPQRRRALVASSLSMVVAVVAVVVLVPATRTGAASLLLSRSKPALRAKTGGLSPRPATGPAPKPMARSAPLAGAPFGGSPAVGALFSMNGSSLGGHYCTASVVDSATRDLIITAAHCVTQGPGGTIAFAPGYLRGQTPYGVWTASQVVVDQQWSAAADPDHDVAFLVVNRPGSNAKIQDVTGAEELGVGRAPGGMVRVIGYPNTDERPISCQNRTSGFSTRQMEFDCQNYTNGTSGGPFLSDVDATSGMGTVIGVIGGYEQGGYDPDVSYSATFGDNVKSLFATAIAKG